MWQIKSWIIPLLLLGLLAGCATSPLPEAGIYESRIELGNASQLTQLYSWPNAPEHPQSLADTLHHYTTQTATRDGMPYLQVYMAQQDGRYLATLRSTDWRVLDYQERLPRFLTIGQLGVEATEQLKAKGLWNEQEWRLFLPLGLAMIEQRSVQLLHFPPDYSLPEQDYLGSKTSLRWESLLIENEVPANQVTLYEAIVDIAPIAAPASAGSTLAVTYPYYAPYARAMLEFLLSRDSDVGHPVVAYGYPVRQWLQQQYGLALQVLDIGIIKLDNGQQASVIAANHPSFIWYAKDKSFDAAQQVMFQDLIAACWQATMGNAPDGNPLATRQQCNDTWHARPQRVCILTWEQAFNKTEREAQQLCQDVTSVTWANQPELTALERLLVH